MRSEIFAYLAGYLDGDGCITYPKYKHRSSVLLVKICSGDRQTLRLFSQVFGGKVHEDNTGAAVKRRIFYWYRTGTSAQVVLQELLPYLVMKKVMAEMVLRLNFDQHYGNGRPVPRRELALRIKAQKYIHAFNQRVTVRRKHVL